ncbi:hypothetical protein K7X08_003497 [Anisodus acutangulus]|uniref:Uncharacterized protein n=1 Tax=Anisodus acutangulus TaxID=402998 RepID=A0A9Q1RJ70_9SOLA|nr:hypothetical protein K7X08_003497 [Anisodus acutangulus]
MYSTNSSPFRSSKDNNNSPSHRHEKELVSLTTQKVDLHSTAAEILPSGFNFSGDLRVQTNYKNVENFESKITPKFLSTVIKDCGFSPNIVVRTVDPVDRLSARDEVAEPLVGIDSWVRSYRQITEYWKELQAKDKAGVIHIDEEEKMNEEIPKSDSPHQEALKAETLVSSEGHSKHISIYMSEIKAGTYSSSTRKSPHTTLEASIAHLSDR